jgi:hypothetical protein
MSLLIAQELRYAFCVRGEWTGRVGRWAVWHGLGCSIGVLEKEVASSNSLLTTSVLDQKHGMGRLRKGMEWQEERQ